MDGIVPNRLGLRVLSIAIGDDIVGDVVHYTYPKDWNKHDTYVISNPITLSDVIQFEKLYHLRNTKVIYVETRRVNYLYNIPKQYLDSYYKLLHIKSNQPIVLVEKEDDCCRGIKENPTSMCKCEMDAIQSLKRSG